MLATGVFAGPAPSGKKTTSSASSVKELVEPKQPNKNGRQRLPTRFHPRPHVFGDALCFAEEEAKTSKDQGGKCGLKKPWKQQVGNEIERRFFCTIQNYAFANADGPVEYLISTRFIVEH